MKTTRVLMLAALLLAIGAGTASAKIIIDDQPPMTWDELLACKLVVAGKYQSHKAGEMFITVERVLKTPPGAGAEPMVKVGDVIGMDLAHWWSVETGPLEWEQFVERPARNDCVRLCYKQQDGDPGPLVPMPVLEKSESALFFFPEAKAVLKRQLQVLPIEHADGWQQALNGKPMDLTFRLAQGINNKLEEHAIVELKAKRDRKIIALLINEIMKEQVAGSPALGLFHGDPPEQLLIAIGDKQGDVYDPVRASIDPSSPTTRPNQYYPTHVLVEVLGQVDPDRALKEFRSWIANPPRQKELRHAAINGLAWVGTVQSLDLAIDLIGDKDGGNTAVSAVRLMVTDRGWPWPYAPPEQRIKLWRRAKERLTNPTPPKNLSPAGDWEYNWLVDTGLSGSGPTK